MAYVQTVAGNDGVPDFADGVGTTASFNCPSGLAIDGEGTLYVADHKNNRIRKVSQSGAVTTLAGSGDNDFADGVGAAASFAYPDSLAIDGEGTLYVADRENHCIRKVSPSGAVTTLAGSGGPGFTDGVGAAASFNYLSGLAIDGEGTLYVADWENHRIRKVSPSGAVTTLAGSGDPGFTDGVGAAASFNCPSGLAIDGEGTLYVADQANNRIRKVSQSGAVTTLAGSGDPGFADGVGAAASFASPDGVAIDGEGTLYVADWDNHRIRKMASVAIPVAPPAYEALSTFSEDLATLLSDDTLADVTFSIDGEHIRAHRLLLVSRSKYFRVMLMSSFQEGQSDSIVTIGDTTPDAFRALLRYVYTDRLICDDTSVVDVMRKAQEIELARLCSLCLQYCRKEVAPTNAISWLVQADTHMLSDLRALTLAYVKREFRRIRMVARSSLLSLSESPELMLQVMDGV